MTNNTSNNKLTIKNEFIAIFLFFMATLLLTSLISYNQYDSTATLSNSSIKSKGVKNLCGTIGAELSAVLYTCFGYSSYILVLYLIFLSTYYISDKKFLSIRTKNIGFLLLFLALSTFLGIIYPQTVNKLAIKSYGGLFGYFTGKILKVRLKELFSIIFSSILIIFSLTLIGKFSIKRAIYLFLKSIAKLFKKIKGILTINKKIRKRTKEFKTVYKEKGIEAKEKEIKEKVKKQIKIKSKKLSKKEEKQVNNNLPEEMVYSPIQISKNYTPPPIDFLDLPKDKDQINYEELEDTKRQLQVTLDEFNVQGVVDKYTPGPVVTTYEFVPMAGVKVKMVTGLAEDLALAIKTTYVRTDRIQGKGAIGIEVPNKKRETIYLSEVIGSEIFQKSTSPLTIALGKEKDGDMFITDLRKMPHLIVAGSTGSGKSVAIHTIILSILFKASSDDVKFILIDPKRVEMIAYENLPHLLTPVIVDMKKAKNSLEWAVWEMERRYTMLSKLKVRDISHYNQKLEKIKNSDDDDLLIQYEKYEKLPLIVIVIDEFADLIMVAKEVEDYVARIAQKARAVGIHLILATQRPSTDVITGTIKNNFPARMALRVPSSTDSRTIINQQGAEKLLGKGDMLYNPPESPSLSRVHCAYVSEEEVSKIVEFLKQQKAPSFNENITKSQAEDKTMGNEDLDDLFFVAARTVIETQTASASYLQRKLSVGYARAGKLIDQLMAYGIISEANSKHKREILFNMEELEKMKEEMEENE